MARQNNKGKFNRRSITVKTNSWLANVVKSLGYSAMDVLEDVAPASLSIGQQAITDAKDAVSAIKDIKSVSTQAANALNLSTYTTLAKDVAKNSLEDLKSGKFYNKQRQDEYINKQSDLSDFDFGGFDLGDEDFDEGEDDFDIDLTSDDDQATVSFKRKSNGKTELSNITMVNNIGPDSPIVQATDFQTETTVKIAKAQADISKSNTTAIMSMMSGVASSINKNLDTINENIGLIATTVNDTLSSHTSVSAKYYEDSMTTFNNILSEIQSLKESIVAPKSAQVAPNLQKDYVDKTDLFSSGALDVREYAKLVAKQFGEYTDSNFIFSSMKMVLKETDTLGMMTAAPLAVIPNMVIKKMIPTVLKHSLEAFDKQLEQTGVALLTRLGSYSTNDDADPILSALGSIFGIRNSMRTTPNKANYQKGAVAWDGIAHRTLVDVIPTYLRQIVSAVTGKQEMVFDYEKGVYRSLKEMQQKKKKDDMWEYTREFSDDIGEMKGIMKKNFVRMDKDTEEYVDEKLNAFFKGLVTRGGGTFRLQKNKNGTVTDDIADILGMDTNDPIVQLIRGYYEGKIAAGEGAAVTSTFGQKIQDTRANITRNTNERETNPYKYNDQYFNNGLGLADPHLRYEKDSTKISGVKYNPGGLGVDQYGKHTNYYLREILKTLMSGIGVYYMYGSGNQGPTSDSGNSKKKRRRKGKQVPPMPLSGDGLYSSKLDKLKTEENSYEERTELRDKNKGPSQKEIEKDLASGKIEFDPRFSDDEGTSLNSRSFELLAREYLESERADDVEENTLKDLMDSSFGGTESGFSKLKANFKNLFSKGGEKASTVLDKATNMMVDLVFGRKDGLKGKQLFTVLFDSIKAQFLKAASFLDEHVFTKLNNSLFGENGLIKRIQNSKFGQMFSGKLSSLKDALFGKIGEDGNRKGGFFSDTLNSFKDVGKQVKEFIFGNPELKGTDKDDSIFGNIKKMTKDVATKVKTSLGIKEDKNKEKKPFSDRLIDGLGDVFGTMKIRFDEWMYNILGDPEDEKNEKVRIYNQFKEDMKGKSGKVGAGAAIGGVAAPILSGHMGLLGNLLLPGGPIGGALLGMGVTIASQSTAFKNFLFGPEEVDNDGNMTRTGGLITKDTQNFFKDNKTGIALGGFAGLAASFGFLPAFFLPGGPLGGALIGGTVSAIAKSKAFQEVLFGKDGTEKDPTGGLTKKLKELYGKDKTLKDLGIDAGIGAGIGVFGSFFLPGGPIIGALAGAATSIAVNSDKFKDLMFGKEVDKDGKLVREGGLFGRFTGYMKDKILSPLATSVMEMQENIRYFIKDSIIDPFVIAFKPVKEEMTRVKDRMVESIKEITTSIKDSFHKRVTEPIGNVVDKYIVEPAKSILSKVFNALGSILGSLVSAPIKAFVGVGNGLYKKHKKEGKQSAVDQATSAFWDSRNGWFPWNKDKREDGQKGFFGSILDYIKATSPKNLKQAQFSEAGAGNYASADNTLEDQYQSARARNLIEHQEKLQKIRSGKGGFFSSLFGAGSTIPKSVRDRAKENASSSTVVDSTTSAVNDVSSKQDTTNTILDRINNSIDSIKSKVTGKDSSSDVPKKSKRKKPVKTKGGKRPTTTKYNTSIDDTEETEPLYEDSIPSGKKSKGTLNHIDHMVSQIADSVYGQLNGVGKNVNKIYRVLLKKSGMSDSEIDGDNNKSYMGFFDKLKTKFQRPIDAIKDIALYPFRQIAKVGGFIKDTIVNLGTTIWNGAKSFGNIVIELGKGLGNAVLSLIQLPVELTKLAITGLKSLLPVMGETLKQGVQVVGTTINESLKVAGSVLVNGVDAIGQTVVSVASGLGQLLGGALNGLGSLLSGLGLITKDLAVTAAKGVFGAVKVLGKGIGAAVTAPFKLIGGLFGKGNGGNGFSLFNKVMHVIVDGGKLDRVVYVDEVDQVNDIRRLPNTGGNEETSNVVRKRPPLFKPSVKMLNMFSRKKTNANNTTINSSGESDSVQRAESEATKKEKENTSLLHRLVNASEKTADSTTTHKISWDSIFSKKGLITGGLLLAIPLIMKLFPRISSSISNAISYIADGFSNMGGITGVLNSISDSFNSLLEFFGIKKKKEKYTIDENGAIVTDENGNAVTEETKVGGIGSRIKNFITPETARVDPETGKVSYDNRYDGITGTKLHAARVAAKKVIKTGSKIAKRTKKARNVASTAIDLVTHTQTANAAKKVIKEKATSIAISAKNSSLVTKVMKYADDAAKIIGEKFVKVANKLGVKNADDVVSGILKLFKKILKPKTIGKYTVKFTKFFAKLAEAAGTLLTSELFWGGLGAVEGATNPRKLFQVSDDQDVNIQMRLISSLFRGFLNTSVGTFLDIIDTIQMELFGSSFVTAIATLMYTLLCGKEKGATLRDNQKRLQSEYQDYVTQEYEAYVKNQQESGQDYMSEEEFRNSGLKTSYSDYIAEKNPSIWKRAYDSIKKGGSSIKNAASTVVNAGKSFVDKKKSFYTGIGNKVAGAGKWLVGKKQSFYKGVGDKIVAANDWISDKRDSAITKVKSAWDDSKAKKLLTSVGNITSMMNQFIGAQLKTAWTGDRDDLPTFDANDPLLELKKTLAIGARIITLPVSLPIKAARKIYDGVTTVYKVTKSFGKMIVDSAKNRLTSALKGETYEPNYSDDESGVSNIVKTVDKVTGIVLSPVTSAISGIRAVKDGITTVWNTLKNVGGVVKETAGNILSAAWKGEEYTFDTAEETTSSLFTNTAQMVTGVVIKPVELTVRGMAFVRDKVKDGIDGFKNMATEISSYADVFGGKVTMSDYWNYPNQEEDGLASTLKRILFTVTRTLLAIPYYISETLNNAKEKIEDTKENIKTGVTASVNWVKNKAESIFGNSSYNITGGNGGFGDENPEIVNGFNYYSQNDSSVKNKEYDNGTMGQRGCGPTALAMVASQMTKGKTDPSTMADIAEKGGYTNERGTSPNYFTEVGSQLGLNPSTQIPTGSNIKQALASGQPVILQGQSGNGYGSPYTKAGHYVVAVGMKGNNVLVNDPRGKSFSKDYPLSKVMEGASGMWSFGNAGYGNTYPTYRSRKVGGRGITDNWLTLVQNVKAAIAAQQPGYSQTKFITITVDGKSLKVRTDCSGFVGACLKLYGAIPESSNPNSSTFTSRSYPSLSEHGFQSMGWSGWDSLKPGDIIAKNGHVEIFSHNANGQHYVFNCGSDSSVNNANATVTGHGEGYSTVWRPTDAGSLSNSLGNYVNSSTAPTTTSDGTDTSSVSGFLSGLAKAAFKPFSNWLGLTDSSSDTGESQTTMADSSTYEFTGKGANNLEQIWNYFTNAGYSKAAVSGIIGNLQQESGLDPEKIQNNGRGPAAGIAQWENYNTKSGRWASLNQYAQSKGSNWTSLGRQLEFIDKELKSLGPFWKHSGNMSKAGTTPTSYEAWKASNNVEEATRQFEGAFERAGKPMMTNRIKYANAAYNKLNGALGGFGEGTRSSSLVNYESNGYDTASRKIANGTNYYTSNTNYVDNATLSKIVTLLESIAKSSSGTNSGINALNKKDFSGGQMNINSSTTHNLLNTRNNITRDNPNKEPTTGTEYNAAKQIASGIIMG